MFAISVENSDLLFLGVGETRQDAVNDLVEDIKSSGFPLSSINFTRFNAKQNNRQDFDNELYNMVYDLIFENEQED